MYRRPGVAAEVHLLQHRFSLSGTPVTPLRCCSSREWHSTEVSVAPMTRVCPTTQTHRNALSVGLKALAPTRQGTVEPAACSVATDESHKHSIPSPCYPTASFNPGASTEDRTHPSAPSRSVCLLSFQVIVFSGQQRAFWTQGSLNTRLEQPRTAMCTSCCEVTWDYDDPDTSSGSQSPLKLQEYLLKIGCILIPFSVAKQRINVTKMFTLLLTIPYPRSKEP